MCYRPISVISDNEQTLFSRFIDLYFEWLYSKLYDINYKLSNNNAMLPFKHCFKKERGTYDQNVTTSSSITVGSIIQCEN